MSVIINSYFTRLSISDFDGLLSRCPSFQFPALLSYSGYETLSYSGYGKVEVSGGEMFHLHFLYFPLLQMLKAHFFAKSGGGGENNNFFSF